MSASPAARSALILVEDDRAQCDAIERAHRHVWDVRRVEGFAELGDVVNAIQCHLRAQDAAAMIVDVRLDGLDGLEVIREVRRTADSAIPILILSAWLDSRVVNDSISLDATCCMKPDHARALQIFLTKAYIRSRLPNRESPIRLRVEEFVATKALTGRELQLLMLSAAGVDRKDLACSCGITENTLKTEIKSLLRKCRRPSLEEVWKDIGLNVIRVFDSAPAATFRALATVEDQYHRIVTQPE